MLRSIVCDYRYPNLCLPVSNGCLLLRAEPTTFCSESKKEADAIKAIYWLGSLKPAAATKKVSCRTTSQTASPFRQPWWEDKSLLECLLLTQLPLDKPRGLQEWGQGGRRDSRRGSWRGSSPLAAHCSVPQCHPVTNDSWPQSSNGCCSMAATISAGNLPPPKVKIQTKTAMKDA